ncbi:hypothetical protein BO70DRAFT_358324 [Aspergillus heteromorphus CBS 117.55]|uniref:Uncharacterized protein n=1 Tax=Aspergillus heteromorphus CBS 117.55 TaxID=1448321 RepID=A0A317X1L4_9EURO|nr:uncharacterized protein BO70DRAFT_358324 [Aspergillus heteromorphus CBS 117.55]PWY90858.1 hypothetical protein BO70DRAFT_358324 [Aspergillus heteromorphus CBS 117.55]
MEMDCHNSQSYQSHRITSRTVYLQSDIVTLWTLVNGMLCCSYGLLSLLHVMKMWNTIYALPPHT